MSWPRASLFIALLVLSAPWASADTITVNTTTDDIDDPDLCSLREAVEYFNLGKPEDGYQGCESESQDDSNVIILPGNEEPYVISSALGAIRIRTALTINGAGRKDTRLADEEDEEPTVTTIEVQGAHRAFIAHLDATFLPPRCARTTPKTCAPASDPFGFDLHPDSDSGDPDVVGSTADYLTTVVNPVVKGTVPGVTATPLPEHTYVIRIYDNPKSGDPVELGSKRVEFSSEDTDWEIGLNALSSNKIHHLTYTTEVVKTSDGKTISEESEHSQALKVAIHNDSVRESISISQLIIKGGCAIPLNLTSCGTGIGTETINDSAPANSDYDPYLLSLINHAPASSSGNGGIIFNSELLTLSNVTLEDGGAINGGAVYSATGAAVLITNSDLQLNSATRGAAIYSESNTLALNRSVLTKNRVNDAAGAVVEVADGTLVVSIRPTEIVNTTLSDNTGRALSLRANTTVNASTIVLNTGGGINFNSQDVAVYNSILAGNGGTDCELQLASDKFRRNLLRTGAGCLPTDNEVLPADVELLANADCNSATGLLCPLDDRGGDTRVHMPRLLVSYTSLASSHIINKASPEVGDEEGACPTADQRGMERKALACDIGAVEVQTVPNGDSVRSGGVTPYNRTYMQSLDYELADEELVPAETCAALSGIAFPPARPFPEYPPLSLADPDPAKVVPNSYRPDLPGCPWLERDAPARGAVAFANINDFDGDGRADSDTDNDGDIDGDDSVMAGSFYSYTAHRYFHGFDAFKLRVVTTVSRLNTLQADRSRSVAAQVIVEPSKKLRSSNVGGALDAWTLLLMALAGLGCRVGRKA